MNLERQMENVDDAENQLEQNWEENRQTESDLVKSLNEKYGAGSLNPQTGEFIPRPTEEVENN